MAAKNPAAPPPMMAILVKEFGFKGLRFHAGPLDSQRYPNSLFFLLCQKAN
jgi:hypothetical protein